MLRVGLIVAGCIGLSAASASADGWETLQAVDISEVEDADTGWRVVKDFPKGFGDGAFEIEGHVVLVVPEPALTEFLLVPDPEGCPFCGPSGYGPTLEVQMARPLPDLPNGAFLRLRGTLVPDTSDETYRIAHLEDAVRLPVDAGTLASSRKRAPLTERIAEALRTGEARIVPMPEDGP